ncbi:type II toxin-antitoxin system VapC family toxin [Phytohabitans kaempferiae]|uniref:Ribonuclease VapC n=1 Tax=Phytohabitans kaempferiae TaxID=1620943 RepID=A0ABV6M9N5_9ACTN
MIVPDASVLVVALVDDGDAGQAIRERLLGAELAAPELVDLEVLSVLRKLVRSTHLSAERAALAIVDLTDLPIERMPHMGLVRRIWQLADNVTPYDASYVALAELLSATLLTSDARLAHAPGPRCRIEVIK